MTVPLVSGTFLCESIHKRYAMQTIDYENLNSYDALGRRLGKWVGYDTIYYYYNANWQVLYEGSVFNADKE